LISPRVDRKVRRNGDRCRATGRNEGMNLEARRQSERRKPAFPRRYRYCRKDNDERWNRASRRADRKALIGVYPSSRSRNVRRSPRRIALTSTRTRAQATNQAHVGEGGQCPLVPLGAPRGGLGRGAGASASTATWCFLCSRPTWPH